MQYSGTVDCLQTVSNLVKRYQKFIIYRELNSVNSSNLDICGSAAIYCDVYRLLMCDPVQNCRHLALQATNNSTSKVEK